MGPFTQPQWPTWAYSGVADPFAATPYTQLSDYPTYLADSMEVYHAHHNHLVHHHQMTRTTESKPRLSKEEVEILEAEFQKNHKPNSSTKKALAESMRVDHARINNWFQNRRAREKKENNIREYEARQRLEKEHVEAEAGRQESDRKRDLVASSAPFPEPRQSSPVKELSPDAPSEHSASESPSELNDVSSPPVTARRTSVQSFAFSHTEEEQFSTMDDGIKSEPLSEDVHDYFSMSDADIDESSHSMPLLNSEMIMPVNGKDSDSYLGNYLGLDFDQTQYQTSYLDQDASPKSPRKQLKSPLPMDIASRRNRRPPPLAINGSRSYPGVPRAAAETSRRSEQGSSMRRVVSANGTVRVTKSTGTPRSPFLQRNRSPVTAGSVAPPTPNTPVVSNTQAVNNGAYPLTSKYSSSALVHDPTLRTPPTTPGIIDSMFNSGSAYEMVMSDEGMVNSNVGSFPSGFELSVPTTTTTTTTSSYVSAKCGSSQPATPLFASQMGPGYFNFYGGSTEYYWSDASTSETSSPGLNLQQAQFMNVPHSGFSHVEN